MTTTAISAFSPLPAAPTTAGAPNAGGDDSAFARELARAGQDEGNQAPPPERAPQRPAKGTETKPRARTAASDAKPAAREAAHESHARPEIAAADDAALKARADDTPADPSALPLPAMLAALMNPAQARPQAAAGGGGDDATAAVGGEKRAAKAGEGSLPGAAADAKGGLPGGADNLPVFALPQAAAPSANASSASGAPTDMHEARVPAPLGSPEFAPALGAQVSLLVRGGMQEARLQINPPELGPITVQIQIDGSNAQVTMAAQQAPTREALEQALPALAGALRDEGLTLTGGGVFEQQPRQRRDEGGEGSGRGSAHAGSPDAGTEDALSARTAPRAAALRGGVDLYA